MNADDPLCVAPALGIRVTRGSQVIIPRGGFEVRLDPESGRLERSVTTVLIAHNMWVDWLDCGVRHLKVAVESREGLRDAVRDGLDDELDLLARREMMASMQAITSCAFALDALADAIARVSRPQRVVMGKARHRQVMWCIRQVGSARNQTWQSMSQAVRMIFHLRNEAVHSCWRPGPRCPIRCFGAASSGGLASLLSRMRTLRCHRPWVHLKSRSPRVDGASIRKPRSGVERLQRSSVMSLPNAVSRWKTSSRRRQVEERPDTGVASRRSRGARSATS